MRDTLTRHKTSSGERLRMGILGILGFMGTPGIAGLRVEGVRGQSHGIGSPPSHVERVLTQYTHVRVLPNRTDRLQKKYPVGGIAGNHYPQISACRIDLRGTPYQSVK